MKFCSRSGERLDVSFDEIKHRIARLCTAEELGALDLDLIVMQTVKRLPDDERLITARTVDDLSARECASLQSVHPLYDSLAAKIVGQTGVLEVMEARICNEPVLRRCARGAPIRRMWCGRVTW